MSGGRVVHVVVPEGIADPRRPSGGNTYDRHVCEGLAATGWSVALSEVAGDWPRAGEPDRRALAGVLDAAAGGALVLVDGLVASAAPEVLVPAGRRVRTVVLVHMPLGAGGDRVDREREGAVLRSTAAVVTTSEWTRSWLLAAYALDPALVQVAHPGVAPADLAAGSDHGGNLLSVGAVAPGKGHDVLVAALAGLVEERPGWRCVCVGPLDRAPQFVSTLRQGIASARLEDRVHLVGPRAGADLDAAYAASDLLVLATRAETYGMVVSEALARGVPALACEVGGVPEALGTTDDGLRPGLLVPPDDPAALARALWLWLGDAGLRRRLREAAAERRRGLAPWSQTAARVARVLEEVAA